MEPTIKRIDLAVPYFSAGMRYGWDKELGDSMGFGIKSQDLNENDTLLIKAGKYGEYSVNKKEALEAVKKYNAYMRRGAIELVVIPQAICATAKTI